MWWAASVVKLVQAIQDRWCAGEQSCKQALKQAQCPRYAQPTQMAIPLQMELRSFVNSWSLQCGA